MIDMWNFVSFVLFFHESWQESALRQSDDQVTLIFLKIDIFLSRTEEAVYLRRTLTARILNDLLYLLHNTVQFQLLRYNSINVLIEISCIL